MKIVPVLLFILNTICFKHLAFCQEFNPDVKRYSSCNSLCVDLDSLSNTLNSQLNKDSTLIVIVIAKETSQNEIPMINMPENYDHSLIKVISFNLRYSPITINCNIKVKANGKNFFLPAPKPLMFLSSAHTGILNYLNTECGSKFRVSPLIGYAPGILQLSSADSKNDVYKAVKNICKTYDHKFLYDYNQHIKDKDRQTIAVIFDSIFTIKMDSIKNSLRQIEMGLAKSSSVSLSYVVPPAIYWSNLTNMNPDYKRNSNLSAELGYGSFPLKFRRIEIGLGLGAQLTDESYSLRPQDFSDTLRPLLKDKDNDLYKGFVSVTKLNESGWVKFFSLIPQITFRVYIPDSSSSLWFYVNPGIKINQLLESSYWAESGSYITYKGKYEKYGNYPDEFDTLGLYGFYHDQKVYGQKKRLSINPTTTSFYYSAGISFKPFKNTSMPFWPQLAIHAEVRGEYSLLNILTNNPDKKHLSSDLQNYNSLLYRSNDLRIQYTAFSLGLAYKF